MNRRICLPLIICTILIAGLSAQIQFSPSNSAINSDNFSGSVMGIADMNADGKDDIIRLDRGNKLSIAYQRAPGLAFNIRTIGTVANYPMWNLSVADINQDGYNDLVMAANENPAFIYYSKPTKDSISYTVQSLVGSESVYAQAANLVDINNDGWLDYFLCNDLGLNKIWANDKNGLIGGIPVDWINFKTTPVSDNSGNYGSLWSDLDNDGDLDLYIAKCKADATDPKDPRRVNVYYRNERSNGFVESAAAAGLATGAQSWVAVAGDSDNDGDQDIFVINHMDACQLFINDGKGKFTDRLAGSGINYNSIGVQAAWTDFDNDGFLDLLISGTQHHLYRNLGQNKFELIENKVLGLFQMESFAIGDLNHDGLVDIYSGYGALFNEPSHRPDAVWINQTKNNNHYIKIRLEGTATNKTGVGARIEVYSAGMRWQREVQSGSAYGIQHSLTQHIGLGTKTSIDSLIVRWTDGTKEKFESPFIDRTMVIKQNSCFSFDPILTINKNVICAPTDSFILNAPLTGLYNWSNGSKERRQVIRTAGSYRVTISTPSGCVVHSNELAILDNPNTKYKVLATDTVLCIPGTSVLSVPFITKVKWNTGDSTATLQVSKPGTYFAQVSNECSLTNTDTVSIRFISVPPITVRNDTVGLGSKGTLRVSGTNIFWYANPTGGSFFHSGNVYVTPGLSKTTTYYVQSTITNPGAGFVGGIKDFTGTSKLHANTFSGRMLFDLKQDAILKSVKVYTDTAATRQIDLLDGTGKIVSSRVQRIEKGTSLVNLDFFIPAGSGYALTTNDTAMTKIFGSKSPRLYRTEGAINYPLISGPLSIFGTNAGPSNYYYFYDWQLNYSGVECSGERIPVTAFIRSVSIKNDLTARFSTYPNPVGPQLVIDGYIPAGSQLSIHSLGGQKIIEKSFRSSQNQYILSTSMTSKGLFILVLATPQGVYSKKLLFDN